MLKNFYRISQLEIRLIRIVL